MAASVLLVEDDEGIGAPLERTLSREGYEVEWVATGGDAVERIRSGPSSDLVILDLGLPDIDGLEVCRRLRDSGFRGPILILTARGDELDRVVGLDSGADDYMAKPFGLAELLARVRALLRRGSPPGPASPSVESPRQDGPGGLRVDVAARRAWVGEVEVQLSAKEFGVLAMLVRHDGSVVTREQFMDEVWDEHWFGPTKTLDVTLGRLRQKLERAGAGISITAVRGVGFRLDCPGA